MSVARPEPASARRWHDRLTPPFAVGMAAQMVGDAISFVLVVVASRFLGLEECGTYALGCAAAVIATTFVFTGHYHALKRSRDFKEDADTLFWPNACVGLAGALCILAAGFAVGGFTSSIGEALLTVSALPLLAIPLSWWEAHLVRSGRVRSASLYSLVAEGVALTAAIWGLQQAPA